METIVDLLPNEHLLDFNNGNPVIPTWINQRHNLRLIIGAGDLDHSGITNIQMFHNYDVFFCRPWNNNGISLRRNVEYLLANFSRQKLICFIDASDLSQIELFTTLFSGMFSLIDGHGGHCPHLPLENIQRLLAEGGEAMNIFEWSECLMTYNEADHWLKNGYFKGINNDNYLTSRIYGEGSDFDQLKDRFITKTQEMISSASNIVVADEFIDNLDKFNLQDLQYICRSLCFNPNLPLNLIGKISTVSKDWKEEPHMEFTVVKQTAEFMDGRFISEYISRNGTDSLSDRALHIMGAIVSDLENGIP